MMLQLQLVWEKQMPFCVTSIAVGQAFKYNLNKLLMGTDDGRVIIYSNKNEEAVLETKGTAIQIIVVHDVTKFGSLDITVGDAAGVVTLFSNHRILNRSTLSHSITAMIADTDMVDQSCIIAGDSGGTLTAISPQETQVWKTRLTDALTSISLSTTESLDTKIRCMLSVTLPDKFNIMTHFIVLCAGTKHVLFFNEGSLVLALPVPSKVNTICSGYFEQGVNKLQLALGGEDGVIYIVNDYVVHKYVRVDITITKLIPMKTAQNFDDLVCIGHFNALKIYRERKLIAVKKTADWVSDVAIGDINDDKNDEIVVCLLNNTVQVF